MSGKLSSVAKVAVALFVVVELFALVEWASNADAI